MRELEPVEIVISNGDGTVRKVSLVPYSAIEKLENTDETLKTSLEKYVLVDGGDISSTTAEFVIADSLTEPNTKEDMSTVLGKLKKAVSSLKSHIDNISNPHGVTKSQVGLGNVPDVATNDQEPTFEVAKERNNIESGDKLSVLFSKIKKWFTDLHKVAFSGKYSDLTGTPINASQSTAGLMSVDDKKKLDGVDLGANKYVHPSTHPASMITEDSTRKFVSVTEKTAWNSRTRTATITVAASNSPAKCKNAADYVCTGTNDQNTINNILDNILPTTGGKIVLLDGTYSVSDRIYIKKSNVTIEGMGASTIVKGTSASHVIFVGQHWVNSNYLNNVYIRNLYVTGATNTDAIKFYHCNFSKATNCIIENDSESDGIGIYTDGCKCCTFANNRITNRGSGVFLDWGSTHNTISQNIITLSKAQGICIAPNGSNDIYSYYNKISDNFIINSNIGINLMIGLNLATDNYIVNQTTIGIKVSGGFLNRVVGGAIYHDSPYTESMYTILIDSSASYTVIDNVGATYKAIVDNGTHSSILGGKGDNNNYGHLKLSDDLTNTSGVSSGVAATPKAVKLLNDKVNQKQTEYIAATTGTGSAYTVHFDNFPSELYKGLEITIIPHTVSTTEVPTLKVNNFSTGYIYPIASKYMDGDEGLNSNWLQSGKPVKLIYMGDTADTGNNDWVAYACPVIEWDDIKRKPSTFKPSSHASSGTTYGKGTDSNYGHLKLSDSITSTSGVSGGIAATPYAVKQVDDSNLSEKTITTATDFNTLKTTCLYHIKVAGCTNAPTGSWGTLYVDFSVGTPYQLYIADSDSRTVYKRYYSNSTWSSWIVINVTGVKGSNESSYRTGDVNITKANIGLGNVNNTSDANKPVSTATQTALNKKTDLSTAGASALINKLDTASAIPVDNDYFISQYANGGTSTTTYYRRPFSALFSYINSKLRAKPTATFVIGSSTTGRKYSAKDVDYLCTGTNDQDVINKAINDLPSTGGKIILLEGIYTISGSINVNKSWVQIEGAGYHATEIRSTVSGYTISINVTGSSCRISSLTVQKGNNDRQGHGIYSTSTHTNLYNVRCAGFEYGVNITNQDTDSNTFHFDNLRVDDCGKGIHINASGGIAVNSVANGCTLGVQIEGSWNYVSGIKCMYCTTGVKLTRNASGNFVAHCMVYRPDRYSLTESENTLVLDGVSYNVIRDFFGRGKGHVDTGSHNIVDYIYV